MTVQNIYCHLPLVACFASLASRWEPARIVGITMLATAIVDVVNFRLAANDSAAIFVIENFEGKNFIQLSKAVESKKCPFSNQDINVQSVRFGMMRGAILAVVIGPIFAMAARTPFPKAKYAFTAKELAPMFGIRALFVLALSHGLTEEKRPWRKKCLKNERWFFSRGFHRIQVGSSAMILLTPVIAIGMIAARILLS